MNSSDSAPDGLSTDSPIHRFIVKQFEVREPFRAIPLLFIISFLITSYLDSGPLLIQLHNKLLVIIVLGILPGTLFLRLTKISQLSVSRYLMYSTGLSFVLIAIITLIANYAYPLVGIKSPIQRRILLPTFGVILVTGWLFAQFRRERLVKLPRIDISAGMATLAIMLLTAMAFPLFSLWFIPLDSIKLPIFVFLAAVTITTLFLDRGHFNKKLTPIFVVVIALAFSYHTALLSNYAWGWDIQISYFTAVEIMENGYWELEFSNKRNSLLLISLVPAVWAELTTFTVDGVYKFVFPVLFSLVPLGIYHFGRNYANSTVGLLAALVYTFTFTFYNTIPGKQAIGTFYVVLILMIALFEQSKKRRHLLFVLFTFGLVISHYSTSILFLWTLTVGGAYAIVRGFFIDRVRYSFTLTDIILFGVLFITWYMYVSSTVVFSNLVMVPYLGVEQLNELLVGSSNSEVDPRTGLYYLQSPLSSAVKQVYRLLHVSLLGLSSIGWIRCLWWTFNDERNTVKSTIFALSSGFFTLIVVALVLRASFGIDRLYVLILLLLSILAIVGWQTTIDVVAAGLSRILNNVPSLDTTFRTCTILILIFMLFNTGAIHYATDTQGRSFPLKYPEVDYPIYNDGEIHAGEWARTYWSSDRRIAADEFGTLLLNRYFNQLGNIVYQSSAEHAVPPERTTGSGNCVFLRSTNLEGQYSQKFSAGPRIRNQVPRKQVETRLMNTNLLYTNGNAKFGCYGP